MIGNYIALTDLGPQAVKIVAGAITASVYFEDLYDHYSIPARDIFDADGLTNEALFCERINKAIVERANDEGLIAFRVREIV